MNQKPQTNQEQKLIYKQVGDSINDVIFFPPLTNNKEKAPLLLLIPGGGWQRNESISMYNMAKPTAQALREKGFAVATISYRGQQADGVTMESIVEDVYDALSYLAKYAEILKIDPSRMYTMGHSAGAHLSLMAAYDKASRDRTEYTVRGVVGIAPPTFFTTQHLYLYSSADLPPIFKEHTAEEYDRFSPLALADSNSPATYLASGDKDNLITCIQAHLLYEKLLRCNVKAKFTLSKGGDHACLPAEGETAAVPDLSMVLQEAAAFILECEAE